MLYDKKVLNELASQIIEQHSYQYLTFPLAKSIITIPGIRPIEYIFDCLSFCVYSHNLDKKSYAYLGTQLTKQYDTKYSHEDKKCRIEYGVLFHFMSACPEYLNMHITKKVRPDFCLSGDGLIGIEITEFTTERDSVLLTILKQNLGQGKTCAQIKRDALYRHGDKAKSYHYVNLGHGVGIASGAFDVQMKMQVYADEVIKKYTSYRTQIPSFKEFIILCDAQNTICINEKQDSDEIIKIIHHKLPGIKGVTVCILRASNVGPIVDKYSI